MADRPRVTASVVVARAALQQVFDNLRAAGFTLIGPVRRGDGSSAIVLEEIASMDELPVGWSDEQAPGRYRLKQSGSARYFDYNVGPQSWKQFLHPPRLKLFSVARSNGNWKLEPPDEAPRRFAFIGVRACDLRAIAIQDRVLLGGEYRDPHYARRREQIFVLAVNCSQASANCFCTSMKAGPRATAGFDLALTELDDAFVIEVGSEAGAEMLRATGWRPANAFDRSRVDAVVTATQEQIEREFSTEGLPRLLYDKLEHPRWEAVAARCFACANCTMVCPTCFCTTVEDTSNLKATRAERVRVWDSCFTLDFSHVHGGNIRPTIESRYRQWLTHKFASWIDQFGEPGCVGCGRCITWCPAGIDVTEEVKALRESAAS